MNVTVVLYMDDFSSYFRSNTLWSQAIINYRRFYKCWIKKIVILKALSLYYRF